MMSLRFQSHTVTFTYIIVSSFVLLLYQYGPLEKNMHRRHILARTLHHGSNGNTDGIIKLKERDKMKYTLKGYTFNKKGLSTPINGDIEIGVLHSFYPDIEKEAVRHFVEPQPSSPSIYKVRDNQLINSTKENVLSCLSPAMVWYKGQLHMAWRIWLQSTVIKRKDIQTNHFLTNYVLLQTLNEYLQPVGPSRILGIPLDIRHGPEDLRMFEFEQQLYLTFSALTSFPGANKRIYWQFLFDLEKEQTIVLSIANSKPSTGEKNWTPLVMNDTLLLIRSLHPFVVLKCSVTGKCEYAYQRLLDGTRMGKLRGGTPFLHYRDGYYFSIAHTTVRKSKMCNAKLTCRVYNAHIVVVHTAPLRIVYISQHLKLPKSVFRGRPIAFTSRNMIEDDFFFPTSAFQENPDTVVLGGHVNDHSCVLFRLRGIQNLMSAIINADRIDTSPKGNGPYYYDVEDFLFDILSNETEHTFFVHKNV